MRDESDERGSIPEWVMLLVMGIGIVMALWAIVQPDLTSIVSDALQPVAWLNATSAAPRSSSSSASRCSSAAAVMVLLQMALWVWCRNVTVNAADEGARTAAELGRPLADGEARTRSVLHDGLGGSAARFAVRAAQDGDAVVVVATGVAPRIVPFLPSFTVRAEARAFDEDAPPP